uniref:Uncharacterized protein n=1 Tax=Utricularia reniformis TaxID=192314 RepID=A0A1Y0B0K0_9LAMI|nr:hypothetical protein AEK19_MT0668 [Utricularia reniformis]ART30919.1 hypothetical protein AEK19_MT0668 [Utricularia reniformis]
MCLQPADRILMPYGLFIGSQFSSLSNGFFLVCYIPCGLVQLLILMS